MKNIPYTYLIGWPALNKWYYGVRYAKVCHPDDLWVSYWTSSKIVHKFVKENGDPTVKIVRKRFNDVKNAQAWENRVLQKLKVTKNSKWLNGHDSKAFDPLLVPRGDQHWTKQDTVAAKKWKNRDGWEFKNSNGVSRMAKGENHWTKKDTDAAKNHRQRMNSNNNPNNLLKVKQKKSEYLKNNNPVNKTGVREKISKTLTGKKRPKKQCKYCNKEIADSIYTRHHGLKCKFYPA